MLYTVLLAILLMLVTANTLPLIVSEAAVLQRPI
jgi:hypothetical protein